MASPHPVDIEFNGNDLIDPIPVSSLEPNNPYIDPRLWRWLEGDYYDGTSMMAAYEGYWVKARQTNVFLRFNHFSQASNTSKPRRVWLAVNGSVLNWLKSMIPQTSEAIADNDTPPRPMGAFGESVDPVFEGCFLDSVVGGR